MRRFFIESSAVVFPDAEISGPEARHITHVLRLGPGDRVILAEGSGIEHEAEIVSAGSGRVTFRLLATQACRGESPLHITVAQGFLKEKKMDLIVRQLTELGANRFLPVCCRRSIPRPKPASLEHRNQRWRSIVKESLKQCRRGVLMAICEMAEFEDALKLAEDHDLKLAFWEEARIGLQSLSEPLYAAQIRSAFLLAGPEGGFTREEMALAVQHGFHTVSLGPRILRAETAAVASCAIVQFLWGDMGKSS
jgi:16S rRNA (uracil1498-N3)-methyltransferase